MNIEEVLIWYRCEEGVKKVNETLNKNLRGSRKEADPEKKEKWQSILEG